VALIDTYNNALINIISTQKDSWGVSTDIINYDIACRLESKSKLLIGKDGKQIKGSIRIYCNNSVDINYEDKIQISKIDGVAPMETNKQFQILQIDNNLGFGDNLQHKEIWI